MHTPSPTAPAASHAPAHHAAERRGLALGGTVRVSQVQLVQPFLGMLAAVPLLGERLDALSVGFGLAVMATVLAGRRMPVRPIPKSAAQAPQAPHNSRP